MKSALLKSAKSYEEAIDEFLFDVEYALENYDAKELLKLIKGYAMFKEDGISKMDAYYRNLYCRVLDRIEITDNDSLPSLMNPFTLLRLGFEPSKEYMFKHWPALLYKCDGYLDNITWSPMSLPPFVRVYLHNHISKEEVEALGDKFKSHKLRILNDKLLMVGWDDDEE